MNSYAKALLLIALSALALAVLASPGTSAEDTSWTDVDSESGLTEALNGGAKNIRIVSDITVSGDLNIPAGVRVLIPYAADDTSGLRVGGETFRIAGSSYVHLTVTLSGNLAVGGELIIGGTIGNSNTFSYQGHTSAGHSVLINNGAVTLKNGGALTCYGFIEGTGEVVAENGSKVTEPLMITDYSGGDNLLSNHYANQAIFTRYSLSNIRCDFQINHGSTLEGKVFLYISLRNSIYEKETTYIGEKDSFIRLSEGACARLTYDASKSIESDESLGLHSDIGKTTVYLNGGASLEAMDIDLEDYGHGKCSFAEHPFPLPYNIDMVLENGDYLMNEDFRILPGAKLTIGTNATLAVNNSLSVFWGLKDKNYKENVEVNMKYPTTETLASNGFDKSGRLIVSGNLILLDSSEFSGIAEMGDSSASILTSQRTDMSVKTVEHGCQRSDHFYWFGIPVHSWTVDSLTTREMAGYIVGPDGALAILQPDSVYRAGAETVYTMTTYSQNDGAYALGSVFRGGWVLYAPSYQTVSSSISNVLTADKVNSMLSDAGISQDFVIDLNVDSLQKVTLEAGAVSAIETGNGKLSLHCDGISVTFSPESLSNLSGTVELRLNDAPLNDAQKASAEDRATYNFELYSDGSKVRILHGTVNIILPFEPHSEEEKEKVQAWLIDTNGIAHTYRATYSDGNISFVANSMDCYAISLDNVPSRSDVRSDGGLNILVAAVIGIAAIVGGGALIYFILKKK